MARLFVRLYLPVDWQGDKKQGSNVSPQSRDPGGILRGLNPGSSWTMAPSLPKGFQHSNSDHIWSFGSVGAGVKGLQALLVSGVRECSS